MKNVKFERMNLCDLALTCSMYDSLTSFNKSLRLLKESYIPDGIDLSNPVHCASLLEWLNDWGCRHLSKKSHDIASSAILDWYKQEGMKLFSTEKSLGELDDQEITRAVDSYDSLKNSIGAHKTRDGKNLKLDIGPTAASKILFALRPQALMPWDEAMRKEFRCDGSKESYFNFLMNIRNLAYKIRDLCRANDFDILELPRKIDRDGSTVLGLINEYVWVTVTRNAHLPSAQSLILWAKWKLVD